MEKTGGYKWTCSLPCRKTKSARYHSIFENSNLSFEEILLLMYEWCNNRPQRDIIRELKLGAYAVSE